MAQKVDITLVDDLDGSTATQTVPFGFNGTMYEIDLNDKNSEKLRKALMPYVEGARKVNGAAKRSTKPSGEAKRIREWAQSQGMDVPDRGRVPASVREAYAVAHS